VRRERQFAALGFEPDDLKMAAFMIETGNEPIGSLGYDGPLAALAPRANLADHLHETVAVVTNPAIDREREIEHFSTRVLLGPRPAPHAHDSRRWIELATPLLLGGHPAWTGLRSDDFRALARQKGTWLLDDVVARFAADGKTTPVFLEGDRDWEEHPRDALARLGAAAARGVRAGAQLVVVRDHGVMGEGRASPASRRSARATRSDLVGSGSPRKALRVRRCFANAATPDSSRPSASGPAPGSPPSRSPTAKLPTRRTPRSCGSSRLCIQCRYATCLISCGRARLRRPRPSPRQQPRPRGNTLVPFTSRRCPSARRARPRTAHTPRRWRASTYSASTARAESSPISSAVIHAIAGSRSRPAGLACPRCSRTRRTTSRSRSGRARNRARAVTCRPARSRRR